MGCKNDLVNNIDVTPGAQVHAKLPETGVLRFERQGGAMAGTPAMVLEDGALVMHYADGATVRVDDI